MKSKLTGLVHKEIIISVLDTVEKSFNDHHKERIKNNIFTDTADHYHNGAIDAIKEIRDRFKDLLNIT